MNSIVKTFRGRDPKAALDAVKATLGDEAIILNTREIGGLWGKREIEITAARSGEEAPLVKKRPSMDLESEVSALRRIVEELRAEVFGKRAEPRSMSLRADLSPATPVSRTQQQLMERGVEPALASAIALEATLSFLGLGVPVTEPSLGLLIANGFNYLLSGKYWISLYPGIALLITIVSINLVGDQLRDVLNPRLQR